ncbi:MAG TPA: NAD-dependent epimerase/dehydratase family protein [Hanamia sp.]|nr:NAD-dependent epimerase/dehydratase family protein [Hanamia sp.]
MTGNKTILEDLEQIIEAPIKWIKFSGKTVLITGANGFLPAYMVETLLFLCFKGIIDDIKVLALVRNIEKAKARFKYYLDNKNLTFIAQDVCDPVAINQKVDFIIHAASQASPKYYGIDPVGTLSANTLGTINLLRLAQNHSVESFLYFSSSEVYGIPDITKTPTTENDYGYVDPTNVRSCYAESKRMGENMCVSFAHQYGIDIKIIRPFHTFGPGMDLNDGRVFVDFVSDIVNGKDILMKSDGSAKRAYCYIVDAIIAYFTVILNGISGEPYNVGNPDNEFSVLELANTLISLFENKKLKVIIREKSDQNYLHSKVNRIIPDVTKMKELGWVPNVSIRDGLYRTITSYNN